MRPTAAPSRWPYREHRNMAQVIADEDQDAKVNAGNHERRNAWRAGMPA